MCDAIPSLFQEEPQRGKGPVNLKRHDKKINKILKRLVLFVSKLYCRYKKILISSNWDGINKGVILGWIDEQ